MFRKIAFKIAKPVAGGIQDEEAEKAREEENKKRCSETWCSCKERTKEK